MPRKLSNEKIKQIKDLRRTGLSIREIAERLKISPGPVFYYARDEATEKKLGTRLAEIFKNQAGKKTLAFELMFLGETDGETPEGSWGARVYLPFTIVCPGCGEELKEIGFLFDSSTFQDALYCGAEINLRTVSRKEELSLK